MAITLLTHCKCRRTLQTLLTGGALAALLCGCAPRVAVPAAGPFASPAAALLALSAAAPAAAVTATARIDIQANGKRYPLKGAVMLQSPGRLRLESIPLFGPPDLLLSVDGGELRVFLPLRGAFYTGLATAANLARFFPLALPAEQTIALLMGQPPPEKFPASSLVGTWDDGLYRLDETAAGRRVRSLWVDPEGGFLVRVQTFPDGDGLAYSAEFSEPVRVGGGVMPQRVTLSAKALTLTCRYTELRGVEGEAEFSLPVPEGIAPTPLDAGRPILP